MKRITEDQEKLKLVKRLVENQQITFEQGISLLEVEVEVKIEYLPYTPYIPCHDPLKWSYTTGTDIVIK